MILKFGRSPSMTIAVDWDIKHQHKQTNKKVMWSLSHSMVQKLGFNVSLSIGPHTCIFSHIHVCIFYSGRQTAKSGNVDPSDL